MLRRMDALRIVGLRKTFVRPAVDGLDLAIAQGEFFALLGPNGAGKTTTLRMVAGLLKPDEGSISIFGIDALRDKIAAKQLVAWLPEEPLLYELLTPMEYLEFVAGLWSVEPGIARARAEEFLGRLGLWPHRNERCGGFSRGMRQKTVLAGALIHDPKLLILDEPLTGLDAAAARDVKDLLTARVAGGSSIILTTHILEVAERLADRIGIIAEGRLKALGSLADLRATGGVNRERDTLEDVFLRLVGKQTADVA
jgi:ABC-2 type transport system ATP-binding protein